MDKISHFFAFGNNHIRCFEDTDLFEQILCRICFDPHCQIMWGLKNKTDCDTIIDEQNKEVTSKSEFSINRGKEYANKIRELMRN